jgi:hypothetical protein
MRANGSLLLPFATLCGIAAFGSITARAQFVESPTANLFGDDFVKTFDIRAGGIVIENNNRGQKPAKTEGWENLLLFKDGSQLRGRLISAGKDEIVWNRPDFSEPLHLRRTDAHRVYLTPDAPNGLAFFTQNAIRFNIGNRNVGRRGARDAVVPATLKLTGNDWLRGDVTSPDGQNFVLRLANKGSSITAPRSQVEWLLFDWNTAQGGGFDGSILNAEDWLASAPSASLSADGSLVISMENEWLGRLLPQPPLFEVSLEISADSERDSHLWLQPSAPMPNTFSPGAVNVGFDPKQLSLQRFTNTMEQKTFPVPKTGRQDVKGMVRYRVFYDSDKHRIVVFRNGRNVVDWKPDEPKPDGTGATPIRPELLSYLMRMALPSAMKGASISAVMDAMHPSADGLCLAAIPELLATASHSHFGAQFLLSELRARFPRINGISLIGGPGNGDLKLHRIQVGPWDGILPQEGEVSTTEDRLSSVTLGSITGKLESITEKEVIFSQHSDPKSPGLLIHLPRESNPPFDAVARVSLGAAGQLGVASLEIRDGAAHLHTAFAEDLELPAAALNAVSFSSLGPHTQTKGDSLVFKNGDELPGTLISATHDAPLRWKSSSGQELAIELKNLAGIRLADPAPSRAPVDNARVELLNGDRLRGDVVSFDEHQLGFKEPLLGSLSVDRSHVRKLFPEAGAQIRDGADDPEGWITANLIAGPFQYPVPRQRQSGQKPGWLYFDACYVAIPAPRANGQMEARFLSAPVPHQRNGLYEFRGEITEASGNLMNSIISISGTQNAALSINFSGMEMYVNVSHGGRGQRARQIALGEKLGKLSTRLGFRIFVNSVLGTADIMLNGTLVARVGQQADERAPGIDQAVQFGGLSYNGQPIIFSNLWIGPWDGELPRAETGHPSTALANGDVAASAPSMLKDGKYLLETEVGSLRLPAESVSAIAFGGESQPAHPAARLRLVDGSIVHVASFECRDGAFAGHSDVLGNLHLPVKSIEEIIFDPRPLREPLGPAQAAAAPLKPIEAQ